MAGLPRAEQTVGSTRRLNYVIMYHPRPRVHGATVGGAGCSNRLGSEASGVWSLANIVRGFVTLVFRHANNTLRRVSLRLGEVVVALPYD